MSVDSAYAQYLQSPERIALVSDAVLKARWGSIAQKLEMSSALSQEAGATSIGARVMNFVGSPIIAERHTIAKAIDIAAYRGRCVTIDAHLCFVLGGDVDHQSGITHLDILRKV